MPREPGDSVESGRTLVVSFAFRIQRRMSDCDIEVSQSVRTDLRLRSSAPLQSYAARMILFFALPAWLAVDPLKKVMRPTDVTRICSRCSAEVRERFRACRAQLVNVAVS